MKSSFESDGLGFVQTAFCIKILYTYIYIILDDEDSGEDEDVLSRNAIKRYSQQLVDSKTKKHKPRNRKRKTKQWNFGENLKICNHVSDFRKVWHRFDYVYFDPVLYQQ